MLASVSSPEVSPAGILASTEPILPLLIAPSCDGRCCVAFSLNAGARERLQRQTETNAESEFLLAMLVGPLTAEQVAERWAGLGEGYQPPWPYEHTEGKEAFSCKHWNTESHLCSVYESRPRMCRDYPYGEACIFCGWIGGAEVPAAASEDQACS